MSVVHRFFAAAPASSPPFSSSSMRASRCRTAAEAANVSSVSSICRRLVRNICSSSSSASFYGGGLLRKCTKRPKPAARARPLHPGICGRHLASRSRSLRGRLLQRRPPPAASAAASSLSAASAAQSTSSISISPTAIMLQGFHWESANTRAWYHIVRDKVPDMKASGITHLWLPPPSQALGGEAPQGYLPQQYYDLDGSSYGRLSELRTLIRDLKSAGIRAVADVVINHRCAERQAPNGQYIVYEDKVAHPGRRIDWGPWAVCRDSKFHGDGNEDTGEHYPHAPDLDHINAEVRAGITDWLNWLKNDIGFEGFRFDMVKGYAAHFIKEYMDATGMTAANNCLCVGENWEVNTKYGSTDEAHYDQNPARQHIVNWIDGTGKRCSAFDFPTKFILNTAVKGEYTLWRLIDPTGKPPGLMGWWPSKAVTFLENHDTEAAQHRGTEFPEPALELGYAYILTHPGTPCVFWRHMYDIGHGLQECIRHLTAVRVRNGITSRSAVVILKAEADLYLARIDDKLVVKLGSRIELGALLPSSKDGWRLAASGQHWAVWEREQYAGLAWGSMRVV